MGVRLRRPPVAMFEPGLGKPPRLTLGDLVGLVGVLLVIVGLVLWAAVTW